MAYEQTKEDYLNISEDDLQFGKLLGSGGFGDVYQGKWCTRREAVAIKKFRVGLNFLTAEQQADFMKEIAIMHSIHFPHVLNIYGICLERNCAAMIVELMPLGSLFDLLRTETLSWPDRWSIAHQMTKAINHLHQFQPKPIIHCDIKSPNFLLAHGAKNSPDRYLVKVSDFGLAKLRALPNPFSTCDGLQGTLLWKAPELFSRQKHSKASDVFALGVCFWEVATGLIPYDGLNLAEIVRLVVHEDGRPEITDDIVPEYSALMESTWKRHPDERPTCLQLLHNIERDMNRTTNLSPYERPPSVSPSPSAISWSRIANTKLIDTIGRTRSQSSIKLTDQSFTDDDMIVIADEIRKNRTCTNLALCTSDISYTGVAYLTEALTVNTTLIVLDLSGNPLGAAGVANFARVLQVNSTLRKLYLNSTDMGDEGAKILANALRGNRMLDALSVAGNGITQRGARALCDSLESHPSIQSLQFDQNDLGDAGSVHIARLLSSNTSLCNLYLSGVGISDAGHSSLMRALTTNKTLRTLDVARNYISNESVTATVTMMQSNRTLRELTLTASSFSDSSQRKLLYASSKSSCHIKVA